MHHIYIFYPILLSIVLSIDLLCTKLFRQNQGCYHQNTLYQKHVHLYTIYSFCSSVKNNLVLDAEICQNRLHCSYL